MATHFPDMAEVIAAIRAKTVVHFQLDWNAPAGTYTVPVPGGSFVHANESGSVVTEAFDATTPTLTTGDGDDADGYQDNTDAALNTAATVTTPAIKRWGASGNPYANGKYYPTDDTIDFAWDPGTSGANGRLKGFVSISNVKLDGIPAAATT